jgi:hypothetical protein
VRARERGDLLGLEQRAVGIVGIADPDQVGLAGVVDELGPSIPVATAYTG